MKQKHNKKDNCIELYHEKTDIFSGYFKYNPAAWYCLETKTLIIDSKAGFNNYIYISKETYNSVDDAIRALRNNKKQ